MEYAVQEQSADGLGTQLRRLLELLDGDLEKLYREQHAFYKPRYTPVMKALAAGEPKTIKDIASRSSISHSAASQTIARMASLGLVELGVEGDRRYRTVHLSPAGRELLPWLERHWQATQAAADALDQELAFPLSRLLAETISRLEAISFKDRIANHVISTGDQKQ